MVVEMHEEVLGKRRYPEMPSEMRLVFENVIYEKHVDAGSEKSVLDQY